MSYWDMLISLQSLLKVFFVQMKNPRAISHQHYCIMSSKTIHFDCKIASISLSIGLILYFGARKNGFNAVALLSMSHYFVVFDALSQIINV